MATQYNPASHPSGMSLAFHRIQKRDESDNTVIRTIETARNAKAKRGSLSPFVGIPIPGQRPFACKRELLRDSLKGMRITEASVQCPLPGSNGEPYLLVFAETENGIKGSRKFVQYAGINMHCRGFAGLRLELHKWAEAQREKLAEAKSNPAFKGKAAKLWTAINKLRKERKNLGSLTHRSDTSAGTIASERERESWARWHNEKSQRKALANIRAMATGIEPGIVETRMRSAVYQKLYELFGTRARRLSELNTRERQMLDKHKTGDLLAYLQSPELFGLSSGPYCSSYDADEEREYAKRRSEHRRELARNLALAKELDKQIAELQAMLVAESGVTNAVN